MTAKKTKDRWPKIIGLPSAKELERGAWVSECGTKGCLVGHVGAAFHGNPIQHLDEGIATPEWFKVKFYGGGGLGKPATDFLREVCVQMGADRDAINEIDARLMPDVASDLFEYGVAEYDTIDVRAEDDLGPPSTASVSEAWRRAAAKFGYEPI